MTAATAVTEATATADVPLLEARRLSAGYGRRGQVHELTLTVAGAGTTVGMVGESGAGKTTAMLALARLIPLLGGTLTVAGTDVGRVRGARLAQFRRSVQIMPQDNDTPLDPRLTVAAAIGAGLRAHRLVRRGRAGRAELAAAVAGLLDAVGLDERFAGRRPDQLSGGERQRVALARALAVRPRLIIADEPTSALDLVSQARIVELLRDLVDRSGLALVLVSHDLSVVGALCDELVVLLGGRVVESGPYERVVASPLHPYTAALVSAERALSFPTTGRDRRVGEPTVDPRAVRPLAPTGCPYRLRCPAADGRCERPPALRRPAVDHTVDRAVDRAVDGAVDHAVACHHPLPS